jgi:catechol 2,3-dioxygenase-like lactoylglutathione lyase family enzyme
MTVPPPRVDCEVVHPGLPVPDVMAAAEFYTTKLGFTPGFTWGDPPEMAGVNLDHVSVHLMQGAANPNGVGVYFVVEDADELFAYQLANGVAVVEPPRDRPYGLRDYRVRDLNGYELGFGHRLVDTSPPLEIERVDVPVRLEKRLAALLADLAAHKRMSIDSCLEETLLHTFEPLADGVASPHTRRTLRYIEELKRRHGIDYDCHASYRFVEW